MIVSKDGSGDFTTIQQAINSIPENNCIRITVHIKNGIYKEKLYINRRFITLLGENKKETVLTYDDHANVILESGENMGTFNSYSTFIGGDDFIAQNLTFENKAGRVGQALAAYIDGDRVSFKNCRFLGYQDTIFTGALPSKPMQTNTFFRGPRTPADGRSVRLYFEDCYISGDVDFIFGAATTLFNKCEIYCEDRNSKVNGYITAASTPEDQEFGYVFLDCKVTSNASPETFYLGRPWRNYARVAYINCWMGEHIKAEGWNNWSKVQAEQTTKYEEYKSTGPGGKMDKRVPWAKILTTEEAEKYTISNVLASSDNWDPRL